MKRALLLTALLTTAALPDAASAAEDTKDSQRTETIEGLVRIVGAQAGIVCTAASSTPSTIRSRKACPARFAAPSMRPSATIKPRAPSPRRVGASRGRSPQSARSNGAPTSATS